MKCREERHIKTSFEDFLKQAEKCHGEKYDYSKAVYKDTKHKVAITCIACGNTFNQSPNNHIKKRSGCPICSGNIKLDTSGFIRKARSVHGARYSYENAIYVGSREEVVITCAVHGDFKQRASRHLSGNGCKFCSVFVSNTETEFLNLIGIPTSSRNIWIWLDGRRYNCDGIDRNTNTIYEFDGDFWHGNPRKYDQTKTNPISNKTYGELHNATIKKRAALEAAGFNVVHIWEDEWTELQRQWKESMERHHDFVRLSMMKGAQTPAL